jgi:hypothetical protein
LTLGFSFGTDFPSGSDILSIHRIHAQGISRRYVLRVLNMLMHPHGAKGVLASPSSDILFEIRRIPTAKPIHQAGFASRAICKQGTQK